jgi:hypothetical protein
MCSALRHHSLCSAGPCASDNAEGSGRAIQHLSGSHDQGLLAANIDWHDSVQAQDTLLHGM